MRTELPKKWFIVVTKENQTILNDWRVTKAVNYLKHMPAVGHCVMNYTIDGSLYYANTKDLMSTWYPGYEEITFEEFKKFVLNISEEGNKTDTRFPFKLSLKNAKIIIDSACPEWRGRLFDRWGRELLTKLEISVGEKFYREMRKACTIEQHRIFNTVFGVDKIIYPKGTPCLVRNSGNSKWLLAYSDGDGRFSSPSMDDSSYNYLFIRELDMSNLPVK